MAAELPDSTDFKSWEDAFLHPISTVHRLEQQLRAELTTNQQKLRTLVGASYRDLLGTAERIVQMDGAMQEVDMHLGAISRKSNSRALDGITRNYDAFDENMRKQDKQRYAFASQLAVLQACPVVISRLVRKGSSSLLAAKVLVLSRLLHKALSRNLQSPPLLENIRNQLASLRRHLLRHVDRQLSNQNASISAVVQAMCAFALATSSSLKEVLRHFHHVRLQAITSQLDQSDAKSHHILKALKLYIRTIQDTQAMVPKRLVESLVQLKTVPLLKNPDVRSAVELNLEIHERWISEDIQIFTPWIRHDDLGKSETDAVLKDWAKLAFSTLLVGLRQLFSSMENFHVLVKLRTEILETWLNGSQKTARFTPPEALEGLRAAINAKLMELIQERAHRLKLVGAEIIHILDDWKAGNTDSREDLWSSSTTSMDISNGALVFKQAILDRSQGRNDAISRVLHDYEAWLKFIFDIAAVVKAIREQKWDDDLDEVEDQFDVESITAQLNEEDPNLLGGQLAKALNTAFQELEVVITGVETKCGQGSQAIFVLRVLREIRQRIPSQGKSADFALSVVPRLHSKLAKAVSHSTFNSFQNLFNRRKWDRSVPARALWEGSPQLPIQPSPGVFKLLHGLVTAMSEHGNDVWSPAAVQVIKGHVGGHVYSLLQTTLAPTEKPTAVVSEPTQKGRDGTGFDSSTSNMSEDWAVQLLFDVMFLERVLSTTNTSGKASSGTLDGLIKTLEERAMLTTPLKERLQKASHGYWKRTYLLFAYLA